MERPLPEDVRLLELEDRLAADPDGVERDRVLARLEALRRNARARLDKGLRPDDARVQRDLIAGIDAAEIVTRRIWAYFNRRRT